MSIFLGRSAVSSPTGVPYTDRTAKLGSVIGFFFKSFNSFNGFFGFNTVFCQYCDSRRVIPSVFELFKSLKQKGRRICISCKSNYSAHKNNTFLSRTTRQIKDVTKQGKPVGLRNLIVPPAYDRIKFSIAHCKTSLFRNCFRFLNACLRHVCRGTSAEYFDASHPRQPLCHIYGPGAYFI